MNAYQIKRLLIFLAGICLIALGIAIAIRAQLGTTPIAAVPTVLSVATPLSVGTYLIFLNGLFFILQWILLKRNFTKFQLIQLPLTVIFGALSDLAMFLTEWISPDTYLSQWLWTLVSVIVLGLGVYIEALAKLTYLPGNGIVIAIFSVQKRLSFGSIKMMNDICLMSLGVILSLSLLGELQGVREGTIFSAFAVGLVIRGVTMFQHFLKNKSGKEQALAAGS